MKNMKKIGDYLYDETQILGSGSYGSVYLGINSKSKQKVAVKVVSLTKFPQSNRKRILDNFRNEITNMQLAQGVNIIRLLAVQASDRNLYLICEYCNGGNLQKYIQELGRLSEQETLKILRDIIGGLHVLHDNNIVHRDLKPGNVMLHNYTAKVGDFGFSKLTEDHQQMLVSWVGTPPYMSPQILAKEKYTDKTDIWSLGVILYQMLYGRLPWDGTKDLDILPKIYNLPLRFPQFPKVTPQTQDLIRRMLKIEEADRISWEELFAYQTSNLSENNLREKISQIVNGQSQSDLKIKHYAKLYFEFNKVIKSTQQFEKNSHSNMEFVNHLLSVKSKISNNSGLQEQIRKESNHIKNRALIDGIVCKILSARNNAVMLVVMFYEITALIEVHILTQTGLVTAVQTLLLKEASIVLYSIYKIFKGVAPPLNISESDWQIFSQCEQKQTLTTLSRYDSTIVNLLFTTFLNSFKSNFAQTMQQSLCAQILPLANQQFDVSGKTSLLLNKYLQILLDEISAEVKRTQSSPLLLHLGSFIIRWFENKQLRETADYHKIDLFKFYEDLQKADKQSMRQRLLH